MAWLVLGAEVAFAIFAIGLRSWIQLRRTGSSGLVGIRGTGVELVAGAAFLVANVLLVLAPVAELAGWVDPGGWRDRGPVQVMATVLLLAGGVATVWAQLAMGASWRVGVDPTEQTALVTDAGPFRWVRNPIFSAMVVFAAGVAVGTASVLGLAAFLVLLGSVELQVRAVEEPYLRSRHGPTYAAYAARTGRFAPAVGRLR